MIKDKIINFLAGVKLFFKGATDFKSKSTAIIRKEAMDAMDNFMLICFAEELGIPLSISYYTLELLPYLAKDLEKWEIRMMERKSIWEEKWVDYDFDS